MVHLAGEVLFLRTYEEESMNLVDSLVRKKTFLDIPNAAGLAGFSTRHFRRIIDDERIKVVEIGRKFFILSADFDKWQQTNLRKAS